MKNPSLIQFIKTFQLFVVIANTLSFFILFLFIFNSYEFFSVNNPLTFPLQNFNFNLFISILKSWFFNSYIYLINIILINLLLKIIKNMPIFKSWLNHWDSNNQISAIFAKSLVAHFRWNKKIKFKEFIEIYHLSVFQLNMLQYHSQNEHMLKFLKKHDLQFSKDISK